MSQSPKSPELHVKVGRTLYTLGGQLRRTPLMAGLSLRSTSRQADWVVWLSQLHCQCILRC